MMMMMLMMMAMDPIPLSRFCTLYFIYLHHIFLTSYLPYTPHLHQQGPDLD